MGHWARGFWCVSGTVDIVLSYLQSTPSKDNDEVHCVQCETSALEHKNNILIVSSHGLHIELDDVDVYILSSHCNMM